MARVPARSAPARGPVLDVTPVGAARVADGFTVRRALPRRTRRLVGPWCFLDHFGPVRVSASPLDVGLHPHCGLSTVTWLFDGQLLHRDTLGSEQRIRPGQLNWMTAGHGIAHSEHGETPLGQQLHGVQLWVALPEHERRGPASFEHHEVLPGLHRPGVDVTVIAGTHDGESSPATTQHPLVGLDVRLGPEARHTLPLDATFEHAVLVTEGHLDIDGRRSEPGSLVYLGTRRAHLTVSSETGGRMILIGGAPFEEAVLLGWNFVVRDEEELREAHRAWEERAPRFLDPRSRSVT